MKKLIFTIALLGYSITNAQNWTDVSNGTSSNIYDIHFTPDGTGWAVAFNPAEVFKSVDAGADWFYSTTLTGIAKCITFTDDQHGWIGGIDINTGDVILHTTEDAGASWEHITFNSLQNQSINTIKIVDGTGFVFGNYGFAKKCQNPESASASWNNFYVPTQEHIWNAYLPDSESIFLCSDKLYFKNNGSWNEVYNNDVWDIDFSTEDIGYFVGPTVVAKTVDGGHNWTVVGTHPLGSNAVASIEVVGPQDVYIGGANGQIFRSIDGGSTWELDYEGEPNQTITEVDLINGSIWATGRDGLMIVKIDVFNGLLDAFSTEGISLFPNPTTSTIRIQLPENNLNATRTSLYDMTGRLVHQQPFNPNMDVGHLDRGTYIVVVETEEGNFRGSIVRE